jgi:DNA-binding beta-propeller fold protein YncE
MDDGKVLTLKSLLTRLGIFTSLIGLALTANVLSAQAQYYAPSLFFGSFGEGNYGMRYPNDVITDTIGNIIVSDIGNDRILRYNRNGGYLGHITNIRDLQGVAVDNQGNIVALSGRDYQVVKFNRQGQRILEFGRYGSEPGSFISPEGIALDAQGNIYVADTDLNQRIQIFNPQGQFLSEFPTGNGYTGPTGIAVDNQGNIYWTNYSQSQIVKYDRNGNVLMTIGSPGSGAGQFAGLADVFVTPSGHIFAADRVPNRFSRIQVFSPSGEFWTQFGNIQDFAGLSRPEGVAVDPFGRVIVADTYNHRISVFTATVPEVGTMGLVVGSGLAGLLFFRRRRI